MGKKNVTVQKLDIGSKCYELEDEGLKLQIWEDQSSMKIWNQGPKCSWADN